MALPGKLTVGFLHEDNPLKAFFRMKPILIEDASGFAPLDIEEKFPEEGFIRIVPDKNEIAIFKNRMHQMGRYCALDLRKHLNENDKIRPNKNYITGGPERNAYIVYSDVIGRLPLHLIAEVVDTESDLEGDLIRQTMELPGTAYVIVRKRGILCGPWSWAASETEPGMFTLEHAPGQPYSEHPESVMVGRNLSIPIDDQTSVTLMYDLSVFELNEVAPPELERPMERTPVESMPQSTSALMGLEPALDIGQLPKADDIFRSRMAGRFSVREQAVQAQTPFNMRRGRSLHDIVDEQWRKARYDQLGHSVPGQASGRPIANPVEHAANIVNDAWALEDARSGLVAELLKNDEFKEALVNELHLPATGLGGAKELNGKLNDLEAQRLKIISEIDALRLKRDDTKAQLLEELRQSNRKEFSQYERRNKALSDELAQNELAAKSAGKAAERAQSLLDETADQLDERLMNSIIGQRMMELIRRESGVGVTSASHPETYDPTGGELISDVRVLMERAGFPLTNDEAINLLSCMMTGGTLIFSGASGSGKSELTRCLGAALGLCGQDERFVEVLDPGEEAVKRLLAKDDHITPLIVMIDDFNTGDCEKRMQEILRLQETASAKHLPLTLILTAQDAPEGQPLSARLLSRSFLIRLKGTSASAPWKPSDIALPAPERAVSLDALKKIFEGSSELPSKITERLSKLRTELDRLDFTFDRRTLNELWHYCAAARGMMLCSDLELLDLALSQRAMPAMLASMEVNALHELPSIMPDMKLCLSLMDQPLPLPPL